jgi:hypothetical protein
MIWETFAILLGILVLYHIYRYNRFGDDFIGNLSHALMSGVNIPFRASSVLSHPSTWGISNQRQVGIGSKSITTAFTVVGPKSPQDEQKQGVWSPPMGNPAGAPLGRPMGGSQENPPPYGSATQPEEQPFELLPANY